MATTDIAPPIKLPPAAARSGETKEFSLPDLTKPIWKRKALVEICTAIPATLVAVIGAFKAIDWTKSLSEQFRFRENFRARKTR